MDPLSSTTAHDSIPTGWPEDAHLRHMLASFPAPREDAAEESFYDDSLQENPFFLRGQRELTPVQPFSFTGSPPLVVPASPSLFAPADDDHQHASPFDLVDDDPMVLALTRLPSRSLVQSNVHQRRRSTQRMSEEKATTARRARYVYRMFLGILVLIVGLAVLGYCTLDVLSPSTLHGASQPQTHSSTEGDDAMRASRAQVQLDQQQIEMEREQLENVRQQLENERVELEQYRVQLEHTRQSYERRIQSMQEEARKEKEKHQKLSFNAPLYSVDADECKQKVVWLQSDNAFKLNVIRGLRTDLSEICRKLLSNLETHSEQLTEHLRQINCSASDNAFVFSDTHFRWTTSAKYYLATCVNESSKPTSRRPTLTTKRKSLYKIEESDDELLDD